MFATAFAQALPFHAQTGNQAPPLSPDLCRTVDTFDLIPQRSPAAPDWLSYTMYLQVLALCGLVTTSAANAMLNLDSDLFVMPALLTLTSLRTGSMLVRILSMLVLDKHTPGSQLNAASAPHTYEDE